MNIQLRFFASVREAVGASAETVTVPAEIGTVGALRAYLVQRGGVWADALAEKKLLRMACNQLMTDADARLTDGCEVAFFPPVTGG
jgi:molybdopterin synthase sulfur carrier subunit